MLTCRMNATIQALDTSLHPQRQSSAVCIINEDVLPGIAAQHQMINSTGEMDVGFSRYADRPTPNAHKSSLNICVNHGTLRTLRFTSTLSAPGSGEGACTSIKMLKRTG
jgi:hypothetical protein